MKSKIIRTSCIGAILATAFLLVLSQPVSATQLENTMYVGNQPVDIHLLDSVSVGHEYTVTGMNLGMWNTVAMFAIYDTDHFYGGSTYGPGSVYTTSSVAESYWQYVRLHAWAQGAWLAEPVKAIVDY
jgi:hypothetical protein